MLLGFKIDGQDELEALRHFATCDVHFDAAVRALRQSMHTYLHALDTGGTDEKNFVGIQITDSPEAARPELGEGGEWVPMEGTPQDGDGIPPEVKDIIQRVVGEVFGQHMPKSDPRMN